MPNRQQRLKAKKLLLKQRNKNKLLPALPIDAGHWRSLVEALTMDDEGREVFVHLGDLVTLSLDYGRMALKTTVYGLGSEPATSGYIALE